VTESSEKIAEKIREKIIGEKPERNAGRSGQTAKIRFEKSWMKNQSPEACLPDYIILGRKISNSIFINRLNV
jgi:hypothetical protein